MLSVGCSSAGAVGMVCAGVLGWLVGSRLFDVPLVWFAVGWFWLLVFPSAWFVLAVDGRVRFRCVVVRLADFPACSIPWLVGGALPAWRWRGVPGAGVVLAWTRCIRF